MLQDLLAGAARKGSSGSGQGGAAGEGSALLVGFSATPFRLDKKDLGDTFQKIVYQKDLQYMVGHGYLVPPIGYRILTDSDLSSVGLTKQGDFKEKSLAIAVNTRARNDLAVRSYASLAPERKAVAFCVSVQHAVDLAAVFLEAGIAAAAVHNRMGSAERSEALQKFKQGEYQVLTNCEILVEGFDETSIACVVMARPTNSLGLYTQCIGRGLRLHGPDKQDCIVIDMTDRSHQLGGLVSLDRTYPRSIGAHHG